MAIIELKEWEEKTLDLNQITGMKIFPSVNKYLKIYLENGKFKIKASHYVGIFQLTDNITVRVIPKVNTSDLISIIMKAYDYNHNDLKFLEEYEQDFDSINSKKDFLFEFLVKILIKKLNWITMRGFLKRSISVSETRLSIKGKINTKDTLKKSLINPSSNHIVCDYNEKTKNCTENQIIRYTLHELLQSPLDSVLRDEVFRYYRIFKGIQISNGRKLVRNIEDIIYRSKLSKSRGYYIDILKVCMLLLKQMNPELGTKQEIKLYSFVVNMNDIFEKYIRNTLKLKFKNNEIEIKKGLNLNLFSTNSPGNVELKPDIIGIKESKIVYLADVKYTDKLSSDDVYQVTCYLKALNIRKAYIFVPDNIFKGEKIYFNDKLDVQIEVITVNLENVEEFEFFLNSHIYI